MSEKVWKVMGYEEYSGEVHELYECSSRLSGEQIIREDEERGGTDYDSKTRRYINLWGRTPEGEEGESIKSEEEAKSIQREGDSELTRLKEVKQVTEPEENQELHQPENPVPKYVHEVANMQVVDHEPHAWFLFKSGNALFLDVNCNHGPVGYGVMIQLSAEEESEYSQKGHAYLNWLAQAVQDSGPGQGYQVRDVSAIYSEASTVAINEWQAAQKSKLNNFHDPLPYPGENKTTEPDQPQMPAPVHNDDSNKSERSNVLNKRELIKIGKKLAQEFEAEAAEFNHKDDRNWYALEDAKQIESKVSELFESIKSVELDDQLKKSDSDSSIEYPRSAVLAERRQWFFKQCEEIEKGSFSKTLPVWKVMGYEQYSGEEHELAVYSDRWSAEQILRDAEERGTSEFNEKTRRYTRMWIVPSEPEEDQKLAEWIHREERDLLTRLREKNELSQPKEESKLTALENPVPKCALCGELPADLTVNTGRDERFPDGFYKLTAVGSSYNPQFRCCSECGAYFEWKDIPQMYGSGNLDEERLIRLSEKASQLLDKLFSPDSRQHPGADEAREHFEALTLDQLLSALYLHLYKAPEIVGQFVPELVRLLVKTDSVAVSRFLRSYVSDVSERAEEVFEAFRSLSAAEISPLAALLSDCVKIVEKRK